MTIRKAQKTAKNAYIFLYTVDGLRECASLSAGKIRLNRALSKTLDDGLAVFVIAQPGSMVDTGLVFVDKTLKGERDVSFTRIFNLP